MKHLVELSIFKQLELESPLDMLIWIYCSKEASNQSLFLLLSHVDYYSTIILLGLHLGKCLTVVLTLEYFIAFEKADSIQKNPCFICGPHIFTKIFQHRNCQLQRLNNKNIIFFSSLRILYSTEYSNILKCTNT